MFNRTACVVLALAASGNVVGCSCSVETSTGKGDDTTNEHTTKEDAASEDTREAGGDAAGNSGSIDVTLERPDAGEIDVTIEPPDGAVVLGDADVLDADVLDADVLDAEGTSVDADARGADGGDGCESIFATCVEGQIFACRAVGEPEEVFTCPNGCDVETDECLTLQLDQGWFVHQFQLADDSQQVEANYIFESDGLVAIQTANPLPSAYLRDAVFESFVARGKISVTTASDDDMFGFVFGWQDPQHFYLVDWKQSSQDASPCGLAPEGVALKLVDSETELTACLDFWAGTGSDKVVPLVPPTAPGWLENTVYDFQLVFRPGDIHLTISAMDVVVVDIESDDTTYTDGLFGFYNYSQEGVRYEFITIEPAP